ncbi:MAG: tRNA lysidine(34) synthetase TilS [Mucilaginibacter sp.]
MMLPVQHFTDFIAKNALFNQDDKVLAAVSGGMDSVLMVHLFKQAGINFGIAHCNFRLRGDESTRDEDFCRQLANQLDVPFHVIHFDTDNYASEHKISIQMAARDLRYQWFEQLRQQFNYATIALAQHQNDAIETILLNLIRGTGIAGLHGILPKNGSLIRPLLFLTRDEIQKLVTEHKLGYVEDSSNASVKYARNKIRHEVIPKLKDLNPGLENTFENNLKHFRDLELLLELKVEQLKTELLIAHGDELRLPIRDIKKLSPQRLLLFKLLQPYGFNETSVDDIITALSKHAGRVFESTSYRVVLDREHLILSQKDTDEQESVFINLGDHTLHYGSYRLTLLHDDSPLIIKDNPLTIAVDSALLVYPLTLRAWQQSDYFYPLGMKTQKKLSDFFINQKVPLHTKTKIPLLVNGNGEIIWIGGYRLDERYKVNKNTKKVTIFELYKSA